MQMLDSRGDMGGGGFNQGSSNQGSSNQASSQSPGTSFDAPPPEDFDDDIPF